MIDLDTLLADPAHRPPEGWSVRAEAWAAERAGITQAAPLPLLRRRVRVAPVSTLLQLQRAYCALELVQGVLHGR